MKRKVTDRLAAAAVAFMMAAGASPAAVARQAKEQVPLTRVTASYGDSLKGGFLIAPAVMNVPAGISEQYGFEDKYTGHQVTVLDVLVYAHELVYGAELTNVLKATNSSVSAMFGDTSGMYLFFVNGVLPAEGGLMYTIGEALVEDGDTVEFFRLSDPYGQDGYAWFEDPAGSRAIAAVAGEPVILTLMGTYFPMWGNDKVTPFDGAGVLTMSLESHGAYSSAWFTGYLGMTDDRGRLTVTFPRPGTYYLSAADEDSNYGYEVLPPFCAVTVTDPAQSSPAITLSAPVRVYDKPGTAFSVLVNATGWPEGSFRLLDGLIKIPDCLELTGIEVGSRLSGGSLTSHLEGTELRFVYTNTALADVTLAGNDFPATLFTLNFTVKANAVDYKTLDFAAGPVTLKRTFEEPAFSFDTSGATAEVHLIPGIAVSVRELFTGDGTDLIPAGQRAWAVSVTRRSPVSIVYKGGAPLFYSEEFSAKYGDTTFIIFTDAAEPLADLENPDNYAWTEGGDFGPPARIGDADANGVINAQDALDVISTWTRALPAPGDAGILSMNVTADGRIDTFDAISVMEFFISGIEFPVLGK